MSIDITTRPVIVRIGPGAPRPIVVSRPTATAIRDGQPGRSVVVQHAETPVRVEQARTVQVAAIARGVPGRDGRDGAGQVPPTPFSWGDAPRDVFIAPVDGLLTVVRLQFTTAFDDPAARVAVGTLADPGAALPPEWNRPASTIEFENTPDLPIAAGQAVRLVVEPGASAAGAGLLFLTFLPSE